MRFKDEIRFVDEECKAQWRENDYREYWEFVSDFINGFYDELKEEDKRYIYDKVMELA